MKILTKKTIKKFIKTSLLALLSATVILFSNAPAKAITGVNPNGVNVSHTSPTTVFLTFQNLSTGQTPVDAFWCGEVVSTAVSATDPCLPGTLFGRLPQRNNFGKSSGTKGITNFTDIMSIPTSVARRAYQDAQRGKASTFFYVRRFANPTQFVVVTCRMAGGGARVPFSLVDVQLKFKTDRPVVVIQRGSTPPEVTAKIRYNGTGRLTGRWEVVSPGDTEPTAFDLLPEASLPIEERGLQKRYTVVERFDVFLPPTGKVTLPGPDVSKIPHQADGFYKLLFRVQATVDKEGNSNAVTGLVASGGVAGFPMPILRYYVGSADQALINGNQPQLFSPNHQSPAGDRLDFTWLGIRSAAYDRLEVEADGEIILTSIVRGGHGRYQAPPWMKDHREKALKWRITSLNNKGSKMAATRWEDFKLGNSEMDSEK